ncbi:uncharacterized protein LOC143429915 [Xylocopa sonorina]|uniref:uncharacterized protein LOC143429915 n=1 Tax=Xylocopa sonorina TaxID=1818115 RepID=UPI00403B2227
MSELTAVQQLSGSGPHGPLKKFRSASNLLIFFSLSGENDRRELSESLRVGMVENKEPISVAERRAMSSPGTRSVSATQRNRTLTSQSGRSSIHGDSISNSTENASTGGKSQTSTVQRVPRKSSVSPVPYNRPLSTLTPASRFGLKSQYTQKKKRFQALKKELTDKQKVAQDLYNEMSQLRKEVISSGAKDPGRLETIKLEVGSCKPFPATEAATTSEQADIPVEKLSIGKELLESLEERLQEIPKTSRTLCQELLDKQSVFVTFITSRLINASEDTNEADQNTNSDMTLQLANHQRDYDTLRSRLNEAKEVEEGVIAELTKNVRQLVDEYEQSRAKMRESNAMEAQRELHTQLTAAMEELRKEREKGVQSKDRLRQAETQLQKMRTRIRELEMHMANDQERIQQLQATVKNLEGQIKQKDMTMEARLKDVQKSMKSSEDLIAKVEKQRDSFEARLMELREKMSNKENDAMNTIKELSERLNNVTTEVGAEKEKRMHVEEAFAELEERYRNLEEKSNELCELAEKNKDFTITEGNNSENELRLFNELKAAREELEAQRQVMQQLQQEKEEIVAVMHQAASREEDEDSREKLAAELVFKSNELQNLMMQYSEMKKIAKNAQEKNGILERQLIEIQTRLHSQSKEGGKAGLSAHAIELQQQVSDLRNNLAEIIQQKEELETALTQKQLQLEQRDRVMREQSKYLKVRDELLEILKGKVQQENGELLSSDENNEYLEQIAAKTEAIQGLYTALENKQLQIMRLEKMVKLMEDHQDRAQAQRTRLENRIAQLELALQRNKEQRDYTPRQTSSDDDQPYICERCREETRIEKDEERWSINNDSTDNTHESFRNWLANVSSQEVTQDLTDTRDFQNDEYHRESPSIVRNRRYNSMMYDAHGESDNVDDSSRESRNIYEREHRHLYHHHHRIRLSLSNRTVALKYISL